MARRKGRILRQVESTPGANLRQIQRYTEYPLSGVAMLLDELEDEGKVESTRVLHYRRFFPTGKNLHKRERVVLSFVNKPRPRSILQYLLGHPDTRHSDLADALGLAAPTLTYYMKQILGEDVVSVHQEGVEKFYRIKNPKLVKKALDRTAKGFDEVLAKG